MSYPLTDLLYSPSAAAVTLINPSDHNFAIAFTRPFVGRILIVDDAKANLLFLTHLLSQEGYTINGHQSATQAVEEAIALPPDLIILDICMPEMDGYKLCAHFKAIPETRHVPIIFISVLDDLRQKAKAFEAGAIDYITKPFDAMEVLLRVKNHIRTQALYRQISEQNRILQAEIERRKLAELRSNLAEEKFSKAFYSSPNPSTITLLENGRHIEVNDSFCAVTGYTASEIIGRSALDLNLWVNLDDRERLFDLIKTYRRVQNHEFEFRTKFGRIRTAILSCEIIELDGQECLLSLSNDITDRKRAESRLQVANTALQKLADLDGLTKIANRRRFDTYLKYHWDEAKLKDKYLSLILCDVDHFKCYNDHYGHLEGDNCLIRLARIFRHHLPDNKDMVARYGGEEFAIILPGRSPQDAERIIKGLWQAIQDANLPHANSETATYVTVSFGCCTLTPDSDIATARQLIGRADEALYRAKQQGRNRVIFNV